MWLKNTLDGQRLYIAKEKVKFKDITIRTHQNEIWGGKIKERRK